MGQTGQKPPIVCVEVNKTSYDALFITQSLDIIISNILTVYPYHEKWIKGVCGSAKVR